MTETQTVEEQGQRLKRLSKQAKHSSTRQRAMILLASATEPPIAPLLATEAELVKNIVALKTLDREVLMTGFLSWTYAFHSEALVEPSSQFLLKADQLLCGKETARAVVSQASRDG